MEQDNASDVSAENAAIENEGATGEVLQPGAPTPDGDSAGQGCASPVPRAPAIVGKFAAVAAHIWDGIATDDEMAELSAEDVVAIKSDADRVRLRAVTRAKPRVKDDEGRVVEHIASDETPDRMGDIIRVKGWDIANFRRNPVLLFNHDWAQLPIGTVAAITKGRLEDGGPALIAESRFHGDGKYPFADLVWRMVADGDLPAVSVGFIPRKAMRPETPEERNALGLGEYGVIYEKAELLELSVVTVPANPNALMRRLDRMVEHGEASRALVADLMREFMPTSRRVVPVAAFESKVAAAAQAAPTVNLPSALAATAAAKAAPDRIDTLAADVAALKNALTDCLTAVRETLDMTRRAAGAGAQSRVATDSPAKAAPTSRATDPQAFYGPAIEALRKVRQPTKGQ